MNQTSAFTPDVIIYLVIIIALIISNIAVWRTQKAEIKSLKSTHQSFKDLVDGQSQSIQSYKTLINISEIEQYIEIVRKKTIEETIDKFPDFKDAVMKNIEETTVNLELESISFIAFLINAVYKMDKKDKEGFYNQYFPKSKQTIQSLIEGIEVEAEKKRSQILNSTS